MSLASRSSTRTGFVAASAALLSLASSLAAPLSAQTVPAAPTGLAATLVATPGVIGTATMTWVAPASNGGSTITGYNVTSSPAGLTCSTGGALTCSLSGLLPSTSYLFTVTASNTVGTGPASAPLTFLTPGVPGAPAWLTATPGNGSIVLNWGAPATDGGSGVSSYQTYCTPGGQSAWGAGSNVWTLGGLTNGTLYTCGVGAVNAIGRGPYSTITATPSGPPVPPGGLTVSAGNAQASFTWAAPSSNGGSAITGYTVTSTPGGLTCKTTGALACTMTGLTYGTLYSFVVTATNSLGTSGPSSPVSAKTPMPSQPVSK